MGRTALFLLLAVAIALPGDARALDCPFVPLERRLEGADAAFVGELVAQRSLADGEVLTRFDVRQQIRGTGGSEVEVRSERPLTDAEDRPLAAGTVVGVLAELDGAALTTSSCLLTDPAALLAVSDEPRGGLIKIALGIVFTLLVVGWAIVRRRKGTRPELPGSSSV